MGDSTGKRTVEAWMIPETESTSSKRHHKILTAPMVFSCVLFALLWAIYPFARSAFRLQVNYNEGWNVYSAERVVHHLSLYPEAYGWQTVNYPILSFYFMAFLHRFTHEYLLTARIVSLFSLVACCALCGTIVRQLSRSKQAALLSAFFCLGVFCTSANLYVGMDDPQLLAQVFFLIGLVVYLSNRSSFFIIFLAATFFVFAGSIKHNPIDFPLAVLCDLTLLSWRRASWFCACGVALSGLAITLNIRFGGPYFFAHVLSPRVYDFQHGLHALALGVLLPLIGPLVLAGAFAWTVRRDPSRRIVAFLLASSLLIGTLFAGGSGVSTSTYFSAMMAISIAIGLFLSDLEQQKWSWSNHPLAWCFPALTFLWLLIPAACNEVINPIQMLRLTAERQRQFDQEVSFMKLQRSPQLCEDLLVCFSAGQPYVYDPFNATQLIRLGKLNPAPFLAKLDNSSFGAIELARHSGDDISQADRFPQSFLDAIAKHYDPALTTGDATLYKPKAH